ncbi:hypothetical protein Pan153_48520 [Gimesia panareensis]|uniref:Uncharacterized protein n=1 Tax=Gimesia panareensis TaxID=2527978 RepID=A0A518FV09_9PLAN|nr:hypothetical protein [Gimesia panareensis]QDV20180.1 hypothetical protein Pan153_48520 [Gimesia panareensis]
MGIDKYLACRTCHVFIDLHKWPVVEEAGQYLAAAHYRDSELKGLLPSVESPYRVEESPYPLIDLNRSCHKILITSNQIRMAIKAGVPDQDYIHKSVPLVESFASTHENHEIFLSCDLGDPDDDPWSPTQPGFEEWYEIPEGPFHFNRYLPRNLIEELGLRRWDEVVEELKDDWPFEFKEYYVELKDQIAAIRKAFERLVSKLEKENKEAD